METYTRILSPLNCYTYRPIAQLAVDHAAMDGNMGLVNENLYIALTHNAEYGVPAFTKINPDTWKFLDDVDLQTIISKLSYDCGGVPTIHDYIKALTAFSAVHRGEINKYSDEETYFCPVLPNFAIGGENIPVIASAENVMMRFIEDMPSDGLVAGNGVFPCIVFCPEKTIPVNSEIKTDDTVFAESAIIEISSLPTMLSNTIRYIGVDLAISDELERRFGEDFYGVVKLTRSETLNQEKFATFIAEHGDSFVCGKIPDSELITYSSSKPIPVLAWRRLRDVFKLDAKHAHTFSDELKKIYDPEALHKEVKKWLNAKYTNV